MSAHSHLLHRPCVRIAALLLCLLLPSACAQKFGENLMRGVEKGLNDSQMDRTVGRLTSTAVASALEAALRDSVQARLRLQLDSIGQVLDQRVNATAVHLRDSLLSEYTNRWLQGRLTDAGNALSKQFIAILDDARGEKTRRLVADLRTELLNDSTLRRAGLFRDELLGTNTRNLLDSLLQQTISGVITRQIRPNTEAIIADMNRKAEAGIAGARRIAWIAGATAVLLLIAAALLYRKARLHKGTLQVLTRQIDQIPDQQVYDQLVRNIRQQTVAQGLEPHLQALLKEEHLYQQEEWKNKDRQVLNLITEYLTQAPPATPTATLLHELHRKAAEVHLEDHLQSVIRQPDTQPEPA